jgi:outer membrane protein OmpA-like peptidoglycan-associated protein
LSKYNQDLSQRRAESARIWLLDAGIAPDRIVAKGYGESQILNRCVDGIRCPEEEHRLNRRTEFKIISGPTTIEIKKSIQLGTKKNEDIEDKN